MKTLAKVLAVLVVVLVVLAGAGYVWASMSASRTLATIHDAHVVDFPIPFPLDAAEVAELGLDEQAARQLATDRAIERGRHLVSARYPCVECHGANFGGGVMVDAFPLGSLLGPNLTAGEGSRTLDYTAADWDRIVRHGILPDGRPAVMPSEDFQLMSDQELSDIVSYIRSNPAVANTVPPSTFGPLGKVLLATGEMIPSAIRIASHTTPHLAQPPAAAVSTEFGRHLAGVCTGCHRDDFSGGPVIGGDPSWPPARNLTPAGEVGTWTYEQFVHALRDGQRPDGTAILPPMNLMASYAQSMTDVELQALWAYIRSVPPADTAGD